MRGSSAPAFAIPSPHDPRERGPAPPAAPKPISSKETSMKAVEKKDQKEDPQEIPDVSGGLSYVDDGGCVPNPFPIDDYPRLPGVPGDPTAPIVL
jgi:hypothetical protein